MLLPNLFYEQYFNIAFHYLYFDAIIVMLYSTIWRIFIILFSHTVFHKNRWYFAWNSFFACYFNISLRSLKNIYLIIRFSVSIDGVFITTRYWIFPVNAIFNIALYCLKIFI